MTITPVPTKSAGSSLSHDDWNAVAAAINALITGSAAADIQAPITAKQINNLQLGLSQINSTIPAQITALQATDASTATALATLTATSTSNSNRLTALENVALPAVPNPVTAVHTTAMTTTTAAVAWTAPASGPAPTDYLVEWSIQNSNIWSSVGAGLVGGTGVTKTVTGLASSTASVTKSYLFRVTSKDAAGPCATSVVSASASATLAAPVTSPDPTVVSVGTGTFITAASGDVWGISVGSQVTVNGTPDTTTSNVVQLGYVAGKVWQQNASGFWFFKTIPSDTWSTGTRTSPLPSSTTLTAPAQASSVGFTQLVGGAEFNSASDATNVIDGSVIAPFYNANDGNPILPANGWSIANSNLTLTTPANPTWGQGMQTINSRAAPISVGPVSAHGVVPNTGKGVQYRYYYVEFRATFPWVPGQTTALWSWAYTADGTRVLEVDVMEVSSQSLAYPTFIDHEPDTNTLPLRWFDGTVDPIANNALLDKTPGAYNTYGFLWTPTFMGWYYNNTLVVSFPTDVPIPWHSDNNAHPVSGTLETANIFCNLPAMALTPIVGIWQGPLSVDWVRIWQ